MDRDLFYVFEEEEDEREYSFRAPAARGRLREQTRERKLLSVEVGVRTRGLLRGL